MKKYIVTRLVILVLVITSILLAICTYAILHTTYIGFYNEAHSQIEQIEYILSDNDENVAQLQEELKEDFIIRANAAAYMIQHNQDIIYDIEQLELITDLLQIDEIHLFTPEGEIYSGNIPDYYGYTFNSGEQMNFFAPLLDDYDLELAQDVTPNTAEGKEMQYIAVWSDDKQHIVQIGIEPLRLLEAMEETELSYIFSRLTPATNCIFFAVDATTGEVVSSTDQVVSKSNITDFSKIDFNEQNEGSTLNTTINSEHGHMLFVQHPNDIYIGYFKSHASIYNSTLLSIAFIAGVSFAIATLIILLIYFMLDRVVLRALLQIGEGMELIAGGNLNYKMNVVGLPEFKALSNNVNYMVNQIVESSLKFSTIFEHVNVPIAMYECKPNAVITTGKLTDIMQISSERLNQDLKSPHSFLAFIDEIMSHPLTSEENVYMLHTDSGDRFLKIMRYQDGESDWGLIVDSTDEINEIYTIKKERDLDFLTGLYGKRAFFDKIHQLELTPQLTKKAAVFMFDLDNLKYVNDTWGHTAGDSFICAAATVLNNIKCTNKLCSRLSGDEFAMIVYGMENYDELDDCLTQIKQQLDTSYINTPNGGMHKVSASVGYALYPENTNALRECLSLADKAMYEVKSNNKGSIKKYNA